MLLCLAVCGPDNAVCLGFFCLVINSNTVTSIIGSVKYPLLFIFLHQFNKMRFKQKSKCEENETKQIVY